MKEEKLDKGSIFILCLVACTLALALDRCSLAVAKAVVASIKTPEK
jgi:hypothetical protein